MGHFFSRTETSYRHTPNGPYTGFILTNALLTRHGPHQAPPAFRVHRTGVHGVHGDAIRRQFFGNGQRKIDPGSVCSTRGEFEVNWLDAIVADDVDDTPPTALLHVRDGRFGRAHVAQEFQIEAHQPVVLGEIFEGAARGATSAI